VAAALEAAPGPLAESLGASRTTLCGDAPGRVKITFRSWTSFPPTLASKHRSESPLDHPSDRLVAGAPGGADGGPLDDLSCHLGRAVLVEFRRRDDRREWLGRRLEREQEDDDCNEGGEEPCTVDAKVDHSAERKLPFGRARLCPRLT
jgi:hypothetical protein